ncbi:MAG: penicillin-binding protein 2 [Verrucomicrobiales bacterium]
MNRGLKKRLVTGCAVLVAFLTVLSGRLVHIEFFRGEGLSEAARSHYEFKEILPAQRGRIFDRSGEPLALSQTVYILEADPYHLRDQGRAAIGLAKKEGVSPQAVRRRYLPEEVLSRYREYVVECLSEPLKIPGHELARMLKTESNGPIPLVRDIEDDYAGRLEEIVDEHDISGIYLRRGERRYYPSPLSLTQVIGYVDGKGDGVAGIEKTFDEQMKGRAGHRYCERDSKRREIHAYRGLQVEPVPGKDVYLTIDMALQSVVERELDAVIDKYRPEKVSAIWMDPSSGEVLAMASRPHFDLTNRKGIRGMDPVRRNIAITDLYQPGSTFKIVGYGGAFDRGLASPSTEVDCHLGSYSLDGFELKDHHPYGKLTAQTAFAKSSNIGAYLIARPLNKEGFHHYTRQFGFGQRTGIELTPENAGRVYDVNEWSRTSFSSQVMGYEVAVTPMQMAVACSVIANGGVHRAPTIVSGVKENARDAEMTKGPDRPGRRVLGEKAANRVLRCMVEVMSEGGTGTKGALPGYSIAGKTGTARKHVEGVGYVHGRYVASFMGFLPAENPKLLGLIVIDDPRLQGENVYGGSVAAPIFQAMARDAVKIFGIEPDLPEETEAEGVTSIAGVEAAKSDTESDEAR